MLINPFSILTVEPGSTIIDTASIIEDSGIFGEMNRMLVCMHFSFWLNVTLSFPGSAPNSTKLALTTSKTSSESAYEFIFTSSAATLGTSS